MSEVEVIELVRGLINKDEPIITLADAARNVAIINQIVNLAYSQELTFASLYELRSLISALFSLLDCLASKKPLNTCIDVPDINTLRRMTIASDVLFNPLSEQELNELAFKRLISNTDSVLDNLNQYYFQEFAFLNGNSGQFLMTLEFVLERVKVIASQVLKQGQCSQQAAQYHP